MGLQSGGRSTIKTGGLTYSTANVTTTPLSASATYTGTFEQVQSEEIFVAVNTDQEGTLYVDFSSNGTDVDSTLSFNYQTDRIFVPVPLSTGGRYTRVRFTNDSSSAQTYIRLFVTYGGYAGLTSTLNSTVAENFATSIVRPTKYEHEVAMSHYQGHTTWNKFGYNTDIDTAGEEVIAAFGGSINIMTSADTLDVVSDSTSDDGGGTGALTILITGIDENNLTQTETVTMDGTTPVTTSNQWLGVNRIVVLTSGSNDANVGNITVDDTSNTVGVQAYVPAGESVTQQCIFHTQINHNFLADWMFLGALKLSGGGGSPRVTFKGFSYSRVTDTTYEVFRGNIDTDVENHLTLLPSQPFVIGGREVFYLTASTDTNNTEVTARFSGIEERVS
jgi:hypothetical protein